MRRLNPFGSFSGFLLTSLLLAGLGVSLWVNRGLAFNPGPLTAIQKEGTTIQGYKSHAEFEKQCVICHEPLKSDLSAKCINCHTDIDQQVKTGSGVHSQIVNVNDCETCHSEHHGREFNPTTTAYQKFDHNATGFSLNWHQQNFDTTSMGCNTCHISDNFKTVDNHTCFDCHNGEDENIGLVHARDFGGNCLGCHDGFDRMQSFNHAESGFPLDGAHVQLSCSSCHTSAIVSEVTKDCKGCHTEPAMHQGLFDTNCAACHSAVSWSPASLDGKEFAHFSTTGFSLDKHQVDYQNNVLTCAACHTGSLQNTDMNTCIACHSQQEQVFMDGHQQQFGQDCLVCHDGVDRLSNFTHDAFFPLAGKHVEIQCTDCHTNNIYRGTAAECWQCHQEPDIHAGVFGLECGDCHSSEGWSPAVLVNHLFPLDHGVEGQNVQSNCAVCHTTNYLEYTCYSCHDHNPDEILAKHQEEGINEQDLPRCIDCHPTGREHETGED